MGSFHIKKNKTSSFHLHYLQQQQKKRFSHDERKTQGEGDHDVIIIFTMNCFLFLIHK